MLRQGLLILLCGYFIIFTTEAQVSAQEDTIQDEYIVVMKADTRSRNRPDNLKLAAMMDKSYHLKVKQQVVLGSRNFISVTGKESDVLQMGLRSDVIMVEPNKVVRAFHTTEYMTTEFTADLDTCQNVSTNVGSDTVWGADRINTRNWMNKATGQYEYGSLDDGHDVTVYVVDTGIKIDHAEFENRASWGYSAISDELDLDLNGHGTHVAGIIGAAQYGVARNAKLVAVKVLSGDGTGNVAGIIDAFQWIIDDYDNHGQTKSVINLSLGIAGISEAMDTAVEFMIEQGLPTVIAAGNEATDACGVSPARVTSGITVGATDIIDTMAYFSNYGKCVDLLAPGRDIPSTYHNFEVIKSISGTSQATPHVAGVVARYLSTLENIPTPEDISDWLIRMSTKGAIEFDSYQRISTPNRLLYMHCYNEGGWKYGGEDKPYPSDEASALCPSIAIISFLIIVFFCNI